MAKKIDETPAVEPTIPPTAADTGASLIRKISVKTICGKVRAPEVPTPLFSVIGVTHGMRDGTGDNGPWVAFLGTFEAVNYASGEVFRSGQCFVPKAIEDILMATVKATEASTDSEGSTQFAIEVGIKPSDTAIGYEYTVKSLVKIEGADPLASLRQKVPPRALLAAPKA